MLVQCATMPRAYAPGLRARRAILLALLDDEPLTIRELAERLPISPTSVYRHVAALQKASHVSIGDRTSGGGVSLTDAGRAAAELLRSA